MISCDNCGQEFNTGIGFDLHIYDGECPEPYGKSWEHEMMKLSKKQLISMIKDIKTRDEKK